MSPVRKAIWFVESNLTAPITLDDVAVHCGVSSFHLTRAFAHVTGRSLMRYWRERRLSVAARTLAAGAPDILAVALDAGYGSHEAFTRAPSAINSISRPRTSARSAKPLLFTSWSPSRLQTTTSSRSIHPGCGH